MLPFDKPISSPVLIGRASTVETLHRQIDAAKTGRGQTILVSGEAGIGKSRLTREAARYAAIQGYLVLQGNCFPNDVHCPYAPFLDLLRTYLAGAENSEREILEREQFPLLPEVIPLAANTTVLSNPEQEKRRLFAILTQFFGRKTSKQPVLCIIEDVHWSDDISLEFLHHLIRSGATQPFVLLITYRSDEIQPALKRLLAQLDRERLARELMLTPFARADVETLLMTIYEPAHPIRYDFIQMLHTLTEGNPFFIEEVLKSISDSTDPITAKTSLNDLYIPRSIQAAVQGRFEHLSEAAQQLVTLAAVVGRMFDFALLQALTRFDEALILQSIKELIAAQLIIEKSPDLFAFRHALTQQAIYAGLLARERKTLHRQIAETIEEMHPDSLEAYTADLAYHWHTAGVWDKTLLYARQAGMQAMNLYALQLAVEHFTRAIEAARQIENAPLIDLYTQRGSAYELLGDFEYARQDLESALEMARSTQNQAAVWENLIALGYLWASRDYAQTGEYYQQALALAQTMNNPIALARSLNRLGNWFANVEQPLEGQRYHRKALDIFEEIDDQMGLAETYDLLGMSCFLGSDLVHGDEYMTKASALFENLNIRSGLVSCLSGSLLGALTIQTDTLISIATPYEVMRKRGETALQIARESGLRSGEVYALATLAALCAAHGEYGQALEFGRQALALAEEIEHRQWIVLAHFGLGLTLSDCLALEAAQAHLEIALQKAIESGSFYWQRATSGHLALVHVLRQQFAQAEAVLKDVVSEETPAQTVAQRLCWRAVAELALAKNDPQTALSIADMLFNSALNIDTDDYGIIPRVSFLRASALLHLHHFEKAENALRELQQMTKARGAKPLVWRSHLALGAVYQAQKRPDDAEIEFDEARAIVNALAETLPEDLRDTYLAQVEASIPRSAPISPRQAARKAFGGLTAREVEVATYIAQGRSNREISDMLVLSERTIEAHVSNILNKLGFTSRSQIAAWAAEKGLLKPDSSG